MKHSLLVLFVLGHFFATAQYCTEDDRFTEKEYFAYFQTDSLTNVEYGRAVGYLGDTTTLLFDIYFPRPEVDPLEKKPFVLMMHGGAFKTGNKQDRIIECITFAQRGFVAATISYRLGWSDTVFLDQSRAMYRAQQDANAALRFFMHHHETYGIDTNALFIGGSSAGAIAINNTHYTDQAEWNAFIPDIETTEGSLTTSGNDLTTTFRPLAIFNNWGAVRIGAMNPEEMIPQIAFHGALDSTVPIDSAVILMGSGSMHTLLQEEGVCTDLTVDPEADHGVLNNIPGANFRASNASCFFKQVLCSSCVSVDREDTLRAQCSSITALEDLEREGELLYPNPVTDELRITSLDAVDALHLYSAQGHLLRSVYDQLHIPMDEVEAGVYFLHVLSGGQEGMFRVVKE